MAASRSLSIPRVCSRSLCPFPSPLLLSPTPTPHAPSACSPVSCSQLLLCPSQLLTMAFLETLPPYPASGFPCLPPSRLIPRGLLPPYPSFSPKRRSVCNGSRRPPCVGLNQLASVIHTTECLLSNPVSGTLLKNCLTSVSTSVKWRFLSLSNVV